MRTPQENFQIIEEELARLRAENANLRQQIATRSFDVEVIGGPKDGQKVTIINGQGPFVVVGQDDGSAIMGLLKLHYMASKTAQEVAAMKAKR